MRKLTLLCLLILLVTTSVQAQDNVWVTTQDNLSLRLGPGQHWERIVVLPPGTTLRAVGRTVYYGWLQVAYEEPLPPGASDEATIDGVTYGWLSANYLVWSGNLLLLPVDGIPTIATGRISGPLVGLGPETPFYETLGDFAHPVQGVVNEPTTAEMTGRIGSAASGYFWVQFELNDHYYWIPTWERGVPVSTYNVWSGSYLFAFGRVYYALSRERNTTWNSLYTIRQRWQDLDGGYAATCNDIPAQIVLSERLTNAHDLAQVPVMQSPLTVLQSAVANINTAIANFENVCAQPLTGRTASAAIIAESLAAVKQAETELRFLDVMLRPIARRDPSTSN
ncbi:MAG: hypothetical protein H6672_02015 [Anaerolineaceae bacterium]|nr:hypothetical protein [Anaerolineaceae bacterium]